MSNPAARLHSILQKAFIGGQHVAGGLMIEGWKEVLGIAQSIDDLTVMSKISRVMALPHAIEREMARFPDIDVELYLGWKPDLAKAFRAVGFNNAFGDFKNQLSSSLLVNIRHCANELERRLPEKEIADSELAEIRQAAEALYDEVLVANLPAPLSRFLLDRLWLLIQALDHYEITGAPGVQYALDAVVGAVITVPEVAQEAGDTKSGQKFWGLMGKVAVALKVAKSFAELIDTARKCLPGNGG